MNYYIFTDSKGSVLEIRELTGNPEKKTTPSDEAASYRKELSKKLGKEVFAWCTMGGDNPIFKK